ncbi:MAG: hypothetical protein RIC55_33875 [Pirellulaceae bacterium]
MSNGSRKLPAGVTPGKLVLIGVLGVILVTVLVMQFGGLGGDTTNTSSEPPASGRGRQTAASTKSTTSTTATTTAAQGRTEATTSTSSMPPRPQWAAMTAAEVRQHDPFAVSAVMSPWLGPEPVSAPDAPQAIDESQQRRATKLQETLNFLRTHGVSVIIDDEQSDGGAGPTAVIGDQTVRVGDLLGGFRVVDINAEEGVVLEVVAETEDAAPPSVDSGAPDP